VSRALDTADVRQATGISGRAAATLTGRPGGDLRAELLALQRTAGNRRVGRLLARAAAVQPAAPCPSLPDPQGEWRTEPWLCQMRAAPVGDNSFLLAHEGQRGAKGDAQGRSVVLVHEVLAHWLCSHPDIAQRVAMPAGDRYTGASANVVREFQAAVGLDVDGVVGPGTLAQLDAHVAAGADGPDPPEVCGRREAAEIERSALEPLELLGEPWPQADRSVRGLVLEGFTVGDASLAKGSAAMLRNLAELLDPDQAHVIRSRTAVECWKPVSATLLGHADCREDPALADRRAEAIQDRFPDLTTMAVRASAPRTDRQLGSADRRHNRAVEIVLALEKAPCDPRGCSQNQLDVIRKANATATPWVNAAIANLDAFAANPSAPGSAPVLEAMRRHFACADLQRARTHARHVSARLAGVAQRLVDPTFEIECHTKSDAVCGSLPAYVRQHTLVVFCPGFFTGMFGLKDGLDQAQDVIHELTHTLTDGPPILDHAYRTDRYYRHMTPDEALTNAESYAALARELATGREVAVDAPLDAFEDCPPTWQATLRRDLAIAQRWNRDAALMTGAFLPDLKAHDPASPVLAAWKQLQRKYLAWPDKPLDEAKRIYEAAQGELELGFKDRSDTGGNAPKIQCEANPRRSRCGDADWYVVVPKFYSTVLHVCPHWLTLAPDKERPQSLLAGLYSYRDLVTPKGARRRLTPGGRALEAERAVTLAALARELSALR
jgi:hypothetical protein